MHCIKGETDIEPLEWKYFEAWLPITLSLNITKNDAEMVDSTQSYKRIKGI